MKGKKYLLSTFVFVFSFVLMHTVRAQDMAIIDSLKKELMISLPDTNRIKILNEIGGYLLLEGNYDEALPYLNKAGELSQELSYAEGLAVSYNRTAIMYMDKNDYEKATQFYFKALEIRKKMGDLHGVADITSNLGILYSDQSEYEKALQCYSISIKIREAIHDAYGLGTSLNLIGNLYFKQGSFKKALQYYSQALQIKQIKADPYLRAVVISNIGMASYNLKNYTEALKNFMVALKIETELGDKEGIADSYHNIGEVHFINGDLTDALEYYQKALVIFEEIGNKKRIAESYLSLGLTYDLLGKTDEALDFFNKQLVLAEEIMNKEMMSEAHLSIAEHYQKSNDYKKAYENYRLYKKIEDEIHDESIIEAMNELEVKYNNQKKETEIESLKAQQIKKDLAYQIEQKIYYIVITSLIFVFLIIFYLFNRRRLRKKQMMERKNFEIQLKALSEQMNPHFIFNSLNSIMEFIRISEKDLALKYLTKFSRLIRLVLESSGKKSVVLSQELELLKLYMELENLRFGGVFSQEIVVDEKMDVHSLEIPPLIIQPFIENSILHGIQNRIKYESPKDFKGKIRLKLAYYDKFLECTVEDNGIGRKKALEIKEAKLTNHQSLGMRITNDRLSMLTQNKCTVEFIDLVDENDYPLGTKAKILIPLIDPFE